MKKKIALIFALCIMAAMLCSCSTSYNEAKSSDTSAFSDGYFTVVKEWDGGVNFPLERIVYANDTGVMYYVYALSYTGGMTPLYNADGTLQIWEGE